MVEWLGACRLHGSLSGLATNLVQGPRPVTACYRWDPDPRLAKAGGRSQASCGLGCRGYPLESQERTINQNNERRRWACS